LWQEMTYRHTNPSARGHGFLTMMQAKNIVKRVGSKDVCSKNKPRIQIKAVPGKLIQETTH
jgi:hypothetical protein